MKKCKKIWAVVVLLLTAVVAQAQTVTVKGHVVDEMGEPMIGATVKAVGQTGGTVTDMDGNYVLSVNGKVSQIEVSYIGYRTQKAAVKNGRADVHMSTDANQLEELVVIGYGSVKKGDVTNAVAQVKGDELAERPVSNIASACRRTVYQWCTGLGGTDQGTRCDEHQRGRQYQSAVCGGWGAHGRELRPAAAEPAGH